mmetsp:Transcript_71014/g.185131  ORF Transcript_71014/g.185131 Transcript_71014/m.185131 type:complete len:154 (+) Transcript_71014:245-706(+)
MTSRDAMASAPPASGAGRDGPLEGIPPDHADSLDGLHACWGHCGGAGARLLGDSFDHVISLRTSSRFPRREECREEGGGRGLPRASSRADGPPPGEENSAGNCSCLRAVSRGLIGSGPAEACRALVACCCPPTPKSKAVLAGLLRGLTMEAGK